MNLRPRHSTKARTSESGSIVVILLVLISIFTVITLGASHSLARLRAEVLALEQRQAARLAGPGTNQPAKDTSAERGSSGDQHPKPVKHDEPAR